MQLSFEQLAEIIESVAEKTHFEFLRVVLASPQGQVRFIEVSTTQFRKELQASLEEGFLALGLLGWELTKEKMQAKSMLFPWHEDTRSLEDVFKQLCEEGVDKVQEELQK